MTKLSDKEIWYCMLFEKGQYMDYDYTFNKFITCSICGKRYHDTRNRWHINGTFIHNLYKHPQLLSEANYNSDTTISRDNLKNIMSFSK
jgi:hypothetical protein